MVRRSSVQLPLLYSGNVKPAKTTTRSASKQTSILLTYRRSADVDAAVRAAVWGGKLLPEETRSFFESRFRFDFSQVRIHDDVDAAQAARAVEARAYTVGHNIVFGGGEYSPATERGRQLLAHELTHVVQQTGKASTLNSARMESRSLRVRWQVVSLGCNASRMIRVRKTRERRGPH